MARLYSNENIPLPVVERLRELGHDALTTLDAGQSNQALPDEDVLAFAINERRGANHEPPSFRAVTFDSARP